VLSQRHTSRPQHHKYASHEHAIFILRTQPNTSLQKFAAANQNGTGSASLSGSGLTLDEACKILNVSPPKAGEANLAQVHERFKRLFDMNDPKKGGSFYLQSKVLRARERIELEVRERQALAEREEEIRTGWKPKLYRD
jgi:import inner membrane translocase subunit TIM16